MKAFLPEKELSFEEWKAARKKGIGGSDAAAITGLNRFKSPLAVYLDKIGEVDNDTNSEYAYWGNALKEIVAREFVKRTSKHIHKSNTILVHPKYDFMIADIDATIDGEDAILKCKTTSAWNAKEWRDDEIPQEYIIQVQHCMAVTSTSLAYFAVLIGGNHFIWKKIERDDELIDDLIKMEKGFWHFVKSKTPPQIDGSKSSVRAIHELPLHYQSVQGELSLPQNVNEIVEERNKLIDQIKRLSEMKCEKENQIKFMMKESETARTDKYMISWKSFVSKRFDSKKFKSDHMDLYKEYTKETSTRRLIIKEEMRYVNNK